MIYVYVYPTTKVLNAGPNQLLTTMGTMNPSKEQRFAACS